MSRVVAAAAAAAAKRTRPNKPAVIAIAGIIGAGKSTLAKQLVHYLQHECQLHAVYIAEPINQAYLELFYSNPAKYAYSFQMEVFRLRVESVREAFEREPDADVYVLDRSVFCDRFFFFELIVDSGWVHAVEQEAYRHWWQLWCTLLPFDIDGFVYLRPDVDECMERVKGRARPGEELIPTDYQRRLMAKHDEFFGSNGHVNTLKVLPKEAARPCLRLLDNRNFRDDAAVAREVCAQIEQWLRSERIVVAN